MSSKKRTYTCESRPLTSDCVDITPEFGYWSPGHHDASVFCAEVKREWDEEIPADQVKHVYVHWVPTPGAYRHNTAYSVDGPKRGAQPVTWWERPI
jgi:hypothetical protein